MVSLFKLIELLASWPLWISGSISEKPKMPEPISYVEQQFALGNSVPLSIVDLYDLELIPGVSDKLGNNILSKRQEIITDALLNGLNNQSDPFELVHGVGKKSASKLRRFIRPE